jgi:hypothetical protein
VFGATAVDASDYQRVRDSALDVFQRRMAA